jgi:hypothetical protein
MKSRSVTAGFISQGSPLDSCQWLFNHFRAGQLRPKLPSLFRTLEQVGGRAKYFMLKELIELCHGNFSFIRNFA